MFKKFFTIGAIASIAVFAYFASTKVSSDTISEIKEKLPTIGMPSVKESISEQLEEIEEKITQLATRITDATRELIEKGSDLANEKKQALLDLIEDAKKGIQEERERLKEIRARLDNTNNKEVI